MGVQLYLSTRGSSLDYRFLGRAPDSRWWAENHYSQLTRFEKPTMLIEAPGRAYYSGIPSSRRDRVQTPIRYTLVMEGLNDEEGDKQPWWNLTRMWLQDRDSLGAMLDALVSERIEDWLTRSVAREDILPEIMATLESFWLSLQDSAQELPSSSEEVALDVCWGGVEDEGNQEALLAQLAGHLQATTPQGSEGLLAVLNLAEEEEDLDALLSAHPQKAICLLGRGNTALKKKRPSSLASQPVHRPILQFGDTTAQHEPLLRKKPPSLSSLTEQFSPWWKSGTEKVSETLRKTRETALKQGSEVLKQGSEVLRQGSAAALKSGTDVLKTTEEAIKSGGEVIKQGGEVLLSTGEKTLGTLLNKEREDIEDNKAALNSSEPSNDTSAPEESTSEDKANLDPPSEESDD